MRERDDSENDRTRRKRRLPPPDAIEEAKPRRPLPPKKDDEDDEDPPPRPKPSKFQNDDDRPRRRRRPIVDDDDDEEEEKPRRRRRRISDDDEDDDRPRRKVPPSGMVTVVGVVNLSLAFFLLVFSLAVMIVGPTVLGVFTGTVGDMAKEHLEKFPDKKLAQQAQKDAERSLGLIQTMGLIFFIAVGSCTLVVGALPMLLAGIGVLKRKQWGRALTLILGALLVLVAISNATNYWPPTKYMLISLIVQVLYGILVFVVLLMPKFAKEFK